MPTLGQSRSTRQLRLARPGPLREISLKRFYQNSKINVIDDSAVKVGILPSTNLFPYC
jgi:hypothetical protein